ncbi:MFS general substrate transporter [Pseudovirgaria hyperparasitica]|uniref:MFS general substrate transporter n=1 Tax=Pseudovirgaria hyperparasitica TaxID=470096 RepID=A0A6A6W1H0_9PEZI|nr:MFS general substrate transporter [Pseudovirgaria hyperparasitica]KAF2755936.1 MFS general substrate transporter [Pseudovirgaria hyperparasitica]
MVTVSRYQRWFSSDAFATLVVASAVFTDNFVYDLVIPFLPQMLKTRLRITADKTQQWTSILLATYGAAFLLSNYVVGYATDKVRSKKAIFFWGIIFMIAAVLMFFLGQHIALTVAARAIQGIAAGFVWVSGFAFLTSYLDSSNVGRCMGFVSAGMAAGEIAGPLIGGILYEYTGYYSVMGLVLGILGFDIALRFFLRDKHPQVGRGNIGSTHASLSDIEATGENSTSAGRSMTPGTDEPGFLGSTSMSSDISSNAVHKSFKAGQARLDSSGKFLDFFADPDFRMLATSFYAYAVNAIVQFTLESVLAIFVQRYFGWGSTASGGVIFALLAPTLLSPMIAPYVERHGPRWLSVIFFCVDTVVLIILGWLIHARYFVEASKGFKALYVVIVSILGISIAVLTSSNLISFSVVAKRREERLKRSGKQNSSTGQSFGWLQIAWASGMVLGPLLSLAFLDTIGWLALCIFLAALCLVSGIFMAATWKEWDVSVGG